MKSLLTFDEEEEKTTVEDAFGLTFQVALTDALGSRLTFDLKKDGGTISVTKDSREVFATNLLLIIKICILFNRNSYISIPISC